MSALALAMRATPDTWHEYANLFPMLSGDTLAMLSADIAEHGIREPVMLYQGKVLDGRNRCVAANDIGIDVPTRDFVGDDASALAFVISTNLHRRHLTESQRASIAARLANMPAHRPVKYANLPTFLKHSAHNLSPVSQSEAASLLNVSERSVKTARKVQTEAPAEIVQAVDDGRISVSLAAQVASLPEAAQAEIIAAPADQVREVAREAVKKAHVTNNSGNNEWYTPRAFIDAARNVMGGIDLDPATSEIANRTVGATTIFTAEDDGLQQEWPIGCIWMNPPYAQPLMGQFAERLAQEVERGSEAIVLVNNATETAWFQRLGEVCTAVCFPKTRVRFLDPDGNPGAPLQGQAVLYAGPDVEAFVSRFGQFGMVLRHG
jgi:ParB family chromosome partitioning protein